MDAGERRAAVARYRERKTVAGIYAVLCRATGQRWAGHAPDLSTIRNRLWFTLRHGSSPHRSLQAVWNAHGAESFAFEEIEHLDEEAVPYLRDRMLKDRLRHWCAASGAEAI